MMDTAPVHNKVAAVVFLIASGLLGSSALTWPACVVSWHGFSFTLSGRMLLGLVLLGIACAGTDSIVRGHAIVQLQQQEDNPCNTVVCHPVLHWILPAGWTTASWALLARPAALEKQVTYVAVASGVLALLILTEYYTVNSATRWRSVARFVTQPFAYLVAALVYLAIYESLAVARIAADTVAIASTFLSLRLLGELQCPLPRVLLSALGVGSALGLLSWLLDLHIVSPVLYSFLLVICLYVLTGLAWQFLIGTLRKETSLEYLLVGVVALLLLLLYMR